METQYVVVVVVTKIPVKEQPKVMPTKERYLQEFLQKGFLHFIDFISKDSSFFITFIILRFEHFLFHPDELLGSNRFVFLHVSFLPNVEATLVLDEWIEKSTRRKMNLCQI